MKFNIKRKGCKDTFNSFLVSNASFDGNLEFPIIKKDNKIPNDLILFSKCISSKNNNYWVHFYEDDVHFERIWKNPQKYLSILKRYNGVITPDFSLYRDLPLVQQEWNIYRSRAIGSWLQEKGINVIPNVRFGDKRTYSFCCLGIEKGSIIAIGTHGNLKDLEDRQVFEEGLDYVIRKIQPKAVIVYGKAPKTIFDKYNSVTKIYQFESDFGISRRKN